MDSKCFQPKPTQMTPASATKQKDSTFTPISKMDTAALKTDQSSTTFVDVTVEEH